MTDRVNETDFAKAIASLQEIAKGHSSRGTATTAVETMTGVSGSTQLFHTAANSDPGGWAGSSWRGEGWEDSIDANGTDMGAPKRLAKSIAKSIMDKLAKGAPLAAREMDFVSKGGLNFLKDKDDEEAKKAFPPKKDEDVEKGHPDAAEDKKQIESMVKDSAMKKSDVSKSLIDHAVENPAVQQGFEMAEFLTGWAQVMHKSLQSLESRVTDRVLTAIAKSDAARASSEAEQGNVAKSMAGALASLGEVLAVQEQRLNQIEAGAARAPKSQTSISKSGVTPSAYDGGNAETLTKSQVSERLLDLVKKSEATAQDVLKYDASGELTPELKRKVYSR